MIRFIGDIFVAAGSCWRTFAIFPGWRFVLAHVRRSRGGLLMLSESFCSKSDVKEPDRVNALRVARGRSLVTVRFVVEQRWPRGGANLKVAGKEMENIGKRFPFKFGAWRPWRLRSRSVDRFSK
jgi:hypothetical protein